MNKLILTFLFAAISLICFSQDSLSYFLEYGKRPSKNNNYIDLLDNHNNHSKLPISIIKGTEPGPTLTIVAGVHGYEYPPIIAAQELIKEIQPEQVSGTLIIIPLANPNAFYNRTPFLNPQDNLNLNRVFPGNSSGTITERIANFVTNKVIAKTDVFIDVHGGDANEDLLPFVCYYRNKSNPIQTNKAKLLSESSDFEYIVSYPYTLKKDQAAKYAFKQAVQDGKVALSIECGKLGNLQKDAVKKIKKSIFNILSEMKMYEVEKEDQVESISLDSQAYIKSNHFGIFESDYSSGKEVKKGDVVGYIKNEFGEIIIEIISPQSGTIIYMIGTPPVNVGETIMCIGFK